MKILPMIPLAALVLFACGRERGGDADADADADTDADSDGDADGDADSDGDADGDGDADSDADSDADADADADGRCFGWEDLEDFSCEDVCAFILTCRLEDPNCLINCEMMASNSDTGTTEEPCFSADDAACWALGIESADCTAAYEAGCYRVFFPD